MRDFMMQNNQTASMKPIVRLHPLYKFSYIQATTSSTEIFDDFKFTYFVCNNFFNKAFAKYNMVTY